MPCLPSLQAQTPAKENKGSGLPIGQVFKDFSLPFYGTDGKLQYVFSADEARGVTLNREEVTKVKILLYDKDPDTPTTTITSPKADLFLGQKILRTKNTVKIERSDSVTTGQQAEFNMVTKIYIVRKNVRMLLTNFNLNNVTQPVGTSSSPSTTPITSANSPITNVVSPAAMPLLQIDSNAESSLLYSPGAYSSRTTNSVAPNPPAPK